MKALVLGAIALGLALAGCTTVDFYAPDVGPSWSTHPIKGEWLQGTTVLGVRLQRLSEGYTVGKRSGGWFDGAYVSDRTETWQVTGPRGEHYQIGVVQAGIRYQGTAEDGVLKVSSSDWSRVTTHLVVSDGGKTLVTDPTPWKAGGRLDVRLGTLGITAYSVGKAGEVVTDYATQGLVTGYKVTDGDRLVGYVDTGKQGLILAGGEDPDPLTLGMVLLVARGGDFVPNPATLAVESLVIDLGQLQTGK